LEFYLPEHLYKRIRPNQKIIFSVEAFPHLLFEAKITAINSKIDSDTHNVLIQGTLSNCPMEVLKHQSPLITQESLGDKTIVACDTQLNNKNKIHKYAFAPGMFASIKINQPPKPNTVIIPSTAISYSLYGNAVYIIEKNAEGKKNENGSDRLTVKRVFVNTGEQSGNYTVIKKGVTAGQLVVSAGEIKLQNGTVVAINNEVKLNEVSNPENLGQ
jgi:membrane fusion protein (multidrug efflux system)